MVGVFAKSPGGRAATRRSKHFLGSKGNSIKNPYHFVKNMTELNGEDRVGSKRISPAAALQDDAPFDYFGPAEAPGEPFDLDQPVKCPSPEPSIMEDGILWRAKILKSLRRRNADILSFTKEPECVFRGGSIPTRRIQNRSLENFLFVAHSAPEYEVKKLLE